MNTTLVTSLLALLPSALQEPASEAVALPAPRQFVFFGHERERIREPEFLDHPHLDGAQLKYSWKELEPERDRYALQPLVDDCEFLASHGKRLWVQLQDVSFDREIVPVPRYLLTDPAFGGGIAEKFLGGEDPSRPEYSDGLVARRWDPAVKLRFHALLGALAARLDGKIEGLNLAETALGFGGDPAHQPAGFTPERYAAAVRETMSAARAAFKRSHVVVYANFMPGEWLPGEDRGYLKSIYAHAAALGVGVGGPDLMPHRKGQQNHSLPLIAARPAGVIAALAVQEGNLDAVDPATAQRVTAASLLRYAREELRADYIFWGTQQPHYSGEVLPLLRR